MTLSRLVNAFWFGWFGAMAVYAPQSRPLIYVPTAIVGGLVVTDFLVHWHVARK